MSRHGKLSPWQIVFINEYIQNGGNGKQAYLKAKPTVSDETATVEASLCLRKPNVNAEIERLQAEMAQKTGMSRERWLKGLCQVAEFNLASCFEKKGDDLEVKEDCLTRPDSHALSFVDVKTTTNEEGQVFRKMQVEAHNKLKAYELIGKALGYLNDHSDNVGSTSEELVKAFVKMAEIARERQLERPTIDVEEIIKCKLEGEE